MKKKEVKMEEKKVVPKAKRVVSQPIKSSITTKNAVSVTIKE